MVSRSLGSRGRKVGGECLLGGRGAPPKWGRIHTEFPRRRWRRAQDVEDRLEVSEFRVVARSIFGYRWVSVDEAGGEDHISCAMRAPRERPRVARAASTVPCTFFVDDCKVILAPAFCSNLFTYLPISSMTMTCGRFHEIGELTGEIGARDRAAVRAAALIGAPARSSAAGDRRRAISPPARPAARRRCARR